MYCLSERSRYGQEAWSALQDSVDALRVFYIAADQAQDRSRAGRALTTAVSRAWGEEHEGVPTHLKDRVMGGLDAIIEPPYVTEKEGGNGGARSGGGGKDKNRNKNGGHGSGPFYGTAHAAGMNFGGVRKEGGLFFLVCVFGCR